MRALRRFFDPLIAAMLLAVFCAALASGQTGEPFAPQASAVSTIGRVDPLLNGLPTAFSRSSHLAPRESRQWQGLPSWQFGLARFRTFAIGSVLPLTTQASQLPTTVFELPALYGADGQNSQAIATADLNWDGNPDLIVANQCATNNCPLGSVSVSLGSGKGTFQPPVSYSSGGQYAVSVAVADVNLDGKLDLIVANNCGTNDCPMGSVSVLLGNGDGTFQTAVAYASGGENTSFVAVADVNGDGNPDIVLANECDTSGSCASGTVSVLLGNGNGTFQSAGAYSSGELSASSVAIKDVNGDGHPDLLVANQYACEGACSLATVAVLLGNGDGTFQAATVYDSGGSGAQSVRFGDVNGDGKPDLLVTVASPESGNQEHGAIGVLLGNGDGTFQSVVTYDSGGYEPHDVVAADVNGDGKLDLLAANCGGSSTDCNDADNAAVGVLLGNGDGTFRSAMSYASGGYDASSLALEDVNGDGKPDLLVANQYGCGAESCDTGTVGVLLGNGDGSFQAPAIYGSSTGGTAYADAVGDVNGDGKMDVVVASGGSSGTVSVLLGNGDGTLQLPVIYSSGGSEALAVVIADVNGDGHPDLIVANECFGSGSCTGGVGVLLGNGNGTFQAAANTASGGSQAEAVAVADVNGDGKLDVVVGNTCVSSSQCLSGSVGVLLGNGDGTFQTALTFPSGGEQTRGVAVTDVNGDGKPDIIVVNSCAANSNCQSNGGVSVMLGNGNGTFQTPVDYATGGQDPFSLAVGDVNGDGKPDLIVTNLCDNSGACANGSLVVMLGNGNGTFQTPLATTIPSYSYGALALADFNGDGKLDVASGGAILLLGRGNGKFQDFMLLGAGGFDIATGDLNGDGKPDVAVGDVAVLLNVAGSKVGTNVSLTSNSNPSYVGQPVTLSVTVWGFPGTPAGTVTIKSGSKILGTVSLAEGQASFTTPFIQSGNNALIATYSGSRNFKNSNSQPLTQVVNKYATSTSVSSGQDPSVSGQSVTFTAMVSSAGATPTGTVKFFNGKTLLGSGTLSQGMATLTAKLRAGNLSITAAYQGDGFNNKSTSSGLTQTVN